MGGRNSKQKKYEVSEGNVISDEDSSDDDFIEDNNIDNTVVHVMRALSISGYCQIRENTFPCHP